MSLDAEDPAEDVMVAFNDNEDNDDDDGGGGEVVLNDNDEGNNNKNDDKVVFDDRTMTTRPLPARRGRQRQPRWR